MSVSFFYTLVHYEYHSFHVIRSKHVRSETHKKKEIRMKAINQEIAKKTIND